MRTAPFACAAAVAVVAAAAPASARSFGDMLNRALETPAHAGPNPFSLGDAQPPVAAVFSGQQVDHFDHLNGTTWDQHYFYSTQYCSEPSSCACTLLLIGGEGPLSSTYLTATAFPIYASKLGCALFALEHRGYGNSYPTGDLTLPSLRLISSQQALADLAYFAQRVIIQEKGIKAPIFAVGGSYSGALAAWARQKYGSVFYGALASSAPVQALQDFHQYLSVVYNSLSSTSVGGSDSCAAAVSGAVVALSQQLSTSTTVDPAYKLCEPLQGDDDVANFMTLVIGAFQGAVQYNSPARAPANVATVCKAFTETKDVMATLANVTVELNPLTSTGCLDASYKSMITTLSNTTAGPAVGGRSWLFQTASQFGYYQDTTGIESQWGPLMSLAFNLKIIKDLYGVTGAQNADLIAWTNTYYGSDTPSFSTRTAYINGLIDPWHALSILDVPASSGDVAIVIPTGSHCQDWTPANAGTDVGIAQQKILDTLTTWVNQARQERANGDRRF